jgi:hypothetical protein
MVACGRTEILIEGGGNVATVIWYRTDRIASPIATWDDIEEGIANLESKIHDSDGSFTYTPFVQTRSATWVMTKTEIQGLEDRIHTIADYLAIPHLLTTWSGLMPINYNALNHLIMGLMPQTWIDNGFDVDGSLTAIMPAGYSKGQDIDYIQWLHDFESGASIGAWPLQIFHNLEDSFYTGEGDRYHIFIDVVFPVEIDAVGSIIIAHFSTTFCDQWGHPYDASPSVGVVYEVSNNTNMQVEYVITGYPPFIKVTYDGLADIHETASGNKIPAFTIKSRAGVN